MLDQDLLIMRLISSSLQYVPTLVRLATGIKSTNPSKHKYFYSSGMIDDNYMQSVKEKAMLDASY
jgi:hypothetical protein